MKLLPLLITFVIQVLPCTAELRLAGLVKTSSGYLFAISDSATTSNGRWLRLGDNYNAVHLESFDEGSGVLKAKVDGKIVSIQMFKANIGHSEATLNLENIGDAELRSLGFYRVMPGDTGLKITSEVGISLAEMKALNPDVQFYRLKVGDILIVSPNPPNQAHP